MTPTGPPALPPELPPELPAEAPRRSPWWLVAALGLAALYGLRAWLQCGNPSVSYQLGYAFGAAGGALTIGFVVRAIWKRPYAVLVGVACCGPLLMLSEVGQITGTVSCVETYVKDVDERFLLLGKEVEAWQKAGAAQVGPQRPRADIVRNRDMARLLVDRVGGLVEELRGGAELERRLAEAGVREALRERAIREFSEAEAIVEMFEVAMLIHDVVESGSRQLEALDSHYGKWTRGFGGGVRFDSTVDQAVVDAFAAEVERMESAQQELAGFAGGG